MRKSEFTPDEKVAASLISLKESLKNQSKNSTDGSKAHAEQLVEMGENFLKMRQHPSPDRFPQNPHKLSLSVSPSRILQLLKVMGLGAAAWIVFLIVWNTFTK